MIGTPGTRTLRRLTIAALIGLGGASGAFANQYTTEVNRDGDRARGVLKDGRVVEATLNGDAIPADRIDVGDDVIWVFDEHGTLLMELPSPGATATMPRRYARFADRVYDGLGATERRIAEILDRLDSEIGRLDGLSEEASDRLDVIRRELLDRADRVTEEMIIELEHGTRDGIVEFAQRHEDLFDLISRLDADRVVEALGLDIEADPAVEPEDAARFGDPDRAVVGIAIESIEIDSDSIEGLGSQSVESAVRILEVIPGSPAELAGLDDGTVIVAVDGDAFESLGEFVGLVSDREAGRPVRLTILDGDTRADRVLRTVRSAELDRQRAELGIDRSNRAPRPRRVQADLLGERAERTGEAPRRFREVQPGAAAEVEPPSQVEPPSRVEPPSQVEPPSRVELPSEAVLRRELRERLQRFGAEDPRIGELEALAEEVRLRELLERRVRLEQRGEMIRSEADRMRTRVEHLETRLDRIEALLERLVEDREIGGSHDAKNGADRADETDGPARLRRDPSTIRP